jgi:hypothetical protein
MNFGCGVRMDKTLEETVLKMALKYAKLRLKKWNDLFEETAGDADLYGLERSRLHTCIAEALDCDRELVEEAFTKAAEPFNCRIIDGIVVDGTMKNQDDFVKIYDEFCNNLKEIAEIEDPEKRHPDRITKAQLDEIAKNPPIQGLPSLVN